MDKVNKRGYNKFLDISKDIEVSINENKILEDAACEGIQQRAGAQHTPTGLPMSVDKVPTVAKTITTIPLLLPNGELYTETLYTTPHQEVIRPLIDPDFV